MYRLATYNDFLWTNKGWLLPYIEHGISSPLPYMQYFPSLTICAGSCCGLETSFLVYLAIGSFLLWLVQFIFFFELVHIISFSTGCDMAYSINAVPFILWLPMYLKVMEYCGGAVFSSTSTTSNYCTVALSPWKQHSMKPMILENTARAERSTTHVDVNLWRLLPHNFSHYKSDLVRTATYGLCVQRPPL